MHFNNWQKTSEFLQNFAEMSDFCVRHFLLTLNHSTLTVLGFNYILRGIFLYKDEPDLLC